MEYTIKAKKLKAVKIQDVTIPDDYDLKRDGITQSLLSDFQCCPLRFLLGINRWELVEGDRVFEFGNIYHDILDRCFQLSRFPSKATLKGWLKNYSRKRKKELSSMALYEFDKQLALAEMILQEYFKHYDDEFENIQVDVPEQLFDIDFYGFRLKGKKDLRFYYYNKDNVWLMEHKTKGRIEEDILEDVLNFDLQNLFYLTADDIEYEAGMKNVLYNIIRNPGHKFGKDETLEQYIERIRKFIQKDPDYFFIRYACPYTEQNKKRFVNELKIKLELLNQFMEGFIPFYRNECACKMPFKCKYLRACSSGKLVGYKQRDKMFPELED